MLHFQSMKVINLASGSDGNVTYIESDEAKILLDIGLSCSEIVKRLALINVNPEQIDAIIISHEHGDHMKGADVFCSKFNKPIYAHRSVWVGLNNKLTKVKIENRRLFDGEEFSIKDMIISPFSVPHDVPCFGFSFIKDSNKISILTDLGHTTDRILTSVLGSQIVYLESNYDKKMLSLNEKYPLILKKRIAGPNGHLSNNDAAEFIVKLVVTGTRQVVLSHLSRDNNSPDIAFDTITNTLSTFGILEGKHVMIDVATSRPGVMFKLR